MKYYWLPVLFFIAAYLIPLGVRPKLLPDEFRYAEIPREMIQRNDYVSPRLLAMPYFEKPAFGYQATAVSFRIFGENNFALRLPQALAAGLTALLLALSLRRYTRDPRTAATGALIYLSFGLVYGISVVAVLDSLTGLFVAGTLLTFLPACLEEKFNRTKIVLLLLTGVWAGLAFLTKGFIAFAVPVVVVVPFLLWERRWKDFLTLPWLPLLAAVLVALPWSLAIHREESDFWRYFFWVEHIQRFTAETEGQHPEPWWYYLPPLLGGVFPAALLAPCAIRGWRDKWHELHRRSHIRYMICYAVFPFLFFSASSGKLATYILPCFVPLACLGAVGIAAYFRLGGEYKMFRRITAIFGGILLTAAVLGTLGRLLLPYVAPVVLAQSWFPSNGRFALAAAVLAVGGGLLVACRNRGWNTQWKSFFATLALVIIAGQWAIMPEAFGSKMPTAQLQRLKAQIPPGAIIVSHRNMAHAVAWEYGNPTIYISGTPGEFQYGIDNAPDGCNRFLFPDEFNRLLRFRNRPVVVNIGRERSLEKREFWTDAEVRVYHDNDLEMAVYPARGNGRLW